MAEETVPPAPPVAQTGGGNPAIPIEERLALFAHAPVPDGDARAVMALSLLDWAACGVAGSDEPVAQVLRTHLAAEAGASVLIGGGQARAARAALFNGTVSHALDYDDTHFAHIGHTSVAVVPAVLALAPEAGADMDGVIDACLVGSEAAIRVGIWLGRGHYQVGFHQTATAGAFGATLAAARLLGLDPAQTVAALGLAATRASGLKNQFGTMGKPYNAGLAAETGVEAAQLAALGMTSADRGLTDALGFGETHHGAAAAEGFDGLGQHWLTSGISHKFHACCHGLHAMLEALAGQSAQGVEAVHIATHPRWLSVCNLPAPRTGLEVKFSYRHTAAMALSGISTGAIASFSDATAQDPALVALRERVTVTDDDRLSEMQCRVTLRRGEDDTVLWHDLDQPLPLSERAAKVSLKAEGLLGARASELKSAVESRDLRRFFEALSYGASAPAPSAERNSPSA